MSINDKTVNCTQEGIANSTWQLRHNTDERYSMEKRRAIRKALRQLCEGKGVMSEVKHKRARIAC